MMIKVGSKIKFNGKDIEVLHSVPEISDTLYGNDKIVDVTFITGMAGNCGFYMVFSITAQREEDDTYTVNIAVKEEVGYMYFAEQEKGYVNLDNGLFLATKETMLREQSTWYMNDRYKDFDFSTAPYWVVSEDGVVPKPIHDEHDMNEALYGEEAL